MLFSLSKKIFDSISKFFNGKYGFWLSFDDVMFGDGASGIEKAMRWNVTLSIPDLGAQAMFRGTVKGVT